MNYLSNRRLAKVTSHWVCEIRKITEFPALFLVLPLFSRRIKTDIKQIECQIIFSANIYLFKVKNMKTRERFEIVQSNIYVIFTLEKLRKKYFHSNLQITYILRKWLRYSYNYVKLLTGCRIPKNLKFIFLS